MSQVGVCPMPPSALDQYAQFNDSGPLPVANAPTHAPCKIMRPYVPTTSSPTASPKSMPRRFIQKTDERESEATLGKLAPRPLKRPLRSPSCPFLMAACFSELFDRRAGGLTLSRKPKDVAFNSSHLQI